MRSATPENDPFNAASTQPQLSSRQLIQELEERYQIGLWFWDYRSKAFDWDAGMRRMNGMAVDAPMPQGDMMRGQFPSDDRWMMESVIKHALPVSAWINTVKRGNGSLSYHLCHVNILKDERGDPDLAIGFVQDITAYKQRDDLLAIHSLCNKLRAEEQGIVLLVSGSSAEVIMASGLVELTGYPTSELSGDSLFRIIHPDDREKFARWRAETPERKCVPLRSKARLRKSDGSYGDYDIVCASLELAWEGRKLESWSCIPKERPEGPPSGADLRPELLRASRALLGWTVQSLSQQSGVSAATIARYEGGARLRSSSCESLTRALGRAGVTLERRADGALSLHYLPQAA